jgi:hypothetical protein
VLAGQYFFDRLPTHRVAAGAKLIISHGNLINWFVAQAYVSAAAAEADPGRRHRVR